MSIDEFWHLTNRELWIIAHARIRQRNVERDRDLCLAWHIVALDRTRRLPPLAELLAPPKRRRPEASEEELRRMARLHEQIAARAQPVKVSMLTRKPTRRKKARRDG